MYARRVSAGVRVCACAVRGVRRYVRGMTCVREKTGKLIRGLLLEVVHELGEVLAHLVAIAL